MTKRISTLAVCAAAIGFLMPATALANTFSGRVTGFSPASLSLFDKEVVTVSYDRQTVFTKLITQRPVQESVSLTPRALRVGAYVVVHVPEGKGGVANWVQIATDRPIVSGGPVSFVQPVAPLRSDVLTEAARHRMEARMRRAAPNASESKRPGGPDTAVHCDRIAGRLEKSAGR